jgi:hypothetical protein
MIESWRESKQSQAKFCKENKLSISTIQYWLKKYRETRIETHTQTKLEEQRKSKSFLTVKLAEQEHQSLAFARTGSADRLDIYYPNGVRLSCPISLKPELLRSPPICARVLMVYRASFVTCWTRIPERNIDRFPEDFMFQLTKEEFEYLKSQIATSSWGGRRKLPFVFTEHGVLMLSSVLNSDRAINVNIQIMRIFTRVRQLLNDNLSVKLELEKIKKKLENQDKNIELVFNYLDELMEKKENPKPRRKIGYKLPKKEK